MKQLNEYKQNRWYYIFYIICRVLLAYAFLVAGMVKILGERFASGLSPLHPMGAYLEALHHTGYYYTFIGIAQVIAAIFLLIPRTVTLGALLYLPIIVNIWILSFAVRFEGSHVTSPLMVLANLYILMWNYDKWKYILPFGDLTKQVNYKQLKKHDSKFPFIFFTGVLATFILVILYGIYGHEVMPENSLKDCNSQFVGKDHQEAGAAFCECIHTSGNPLDDCLAAYENAKL
ncbi:DoxX family protein [Algoriphagus sp.]|uniref:DoxX family protein n=1 Tax=Algoriphagus sp. TaxID=1872435 RepID=UPI003274580B